MGSLTLNRVGLGGNQGNGLELAPETPGLQVRGEQTGLLPLKSEGSERNVCGRPCLVRLGKCSASGQVEALGGLRAEAGRRRDLVARNHVFSLF